MSYKKFLNLSQSKNTYMQAKYFKPDYAYKIQSLQLGPSIYGTRTEVINGTSQKVAVQAILVLEPTRTAIYNVPADLQKMTKEETEEMNKNIENKKYLYFTIIEWKDGYPRIDLIDENTREERVLRIDSIKEDIDPWHDQCPAEEMDMIHKRKPPFSSDDKSPKKSKS